MGRPQDSRLQRSGNTPLDPDHLETEISTHPHAPRDEPGGGPVPVENRPGHHPTEDQDKPDLDAFAERLGVPPESDSAETDEQEAVDSSDTTEHPPVDEPSETTRPSGTSSHLRAAATTAFDLAQPVAHVVQAGIQTGVQRAGELLDQRKGLTSRVEALESEVAELRRRLEVLES
ncbi:MAG: hypothetical protein ACXIVQ_02490 [Acidimicrobiales bacterium]